MHIELFFINDAIIYLLFPQQCFWIFYELLILIKLQKLLQLVPWCKKLIESRWSTLVVSQWFTINCLQHFHGCLTSVTTCIWLIKHVKLLRVMQVCLYILMFCGLSVKADKSQNIDMLRHSYIMHSQSKVLVLNQAITTIRHPKKCCPLLTAKHWETARLTIRKNSINIIDQDHQANKVLLIIIILIK